MVLRGYDTGMATAHEIERALSRDAVRRSAKVTRPGLRRPHRAPAEDVGIRLGRRVAIGRRPLFATLEDVVLAVAPPRSGKTAWLGGAVIDAPGAVVATSTKTDLYEYTGRLRAWRGPVAVFNPEMLGGVPSTFRWSPLEGCEQPAIAMERAGYLLSGAAAPGADRDFWEGSSYRLLRCLLFAAAVAGGSMADVARWAGQPRDRAALDILEGRASTPAGWAADVQQLLDEAPDRTRESVFLSLALSLQFMSHPRLAAMTSPAPGEPTFNVGHFIAEGGTLYLMGSERPHDSVAPLYSALTGHIFETAKRLAADQDGGRLDPPLMLALDEAALICPVPLERWTADAGGRGVPLLLAVQTLSQLYERWGRLGGQTIWSNAAVKLIFGGLTVHEHLQELSALCGDRDEAVRSLAVGDGRRNRSKALRRVPVFPPDRLRTLEPGRVIVLHRGTRPVLARIEAVWDRADVRRAGRVGDV